MRTAGAIIDMKQGKITLEVDNECMEFDVLNIMKSTHIEMASIIDSIDIIDECIEEVIHECLRNDSMKPHMMEEANEQILKVIPYQPFQEISRLETSRRENDSKKSNIK